MNQIIVFLGIAAVGNAIYHLGQKTLSPGANPMVLLMAVYVVAFVFAAASAPFFQSAAGVSWKAQVFSWPVLVLGGVCYSSRLGSCWPIAWAVGCSGPGWR